jgi:hypothetical protein
MFMGMVSEDRKKNGRYSRFSILPFNPVWEIDLVFG